MARITAKQLSAACTEVLAGLVASGAYADAEAVNAGYCGDFADDVYEALGGMGLAPHADLQQVGVEGFMVPDAETGEPATFDRNLVARHWPAMVPPEGLDWDDLDLLAAAADFGPGTHTWIALDGLHHDAEAPDGVANPFDLPFLKRLVAAYADDVRTAPAGP